VVELQGRERALNERLAGKDPTHDDNTATGPAR
jgi:hypothetical protein